MNKKGETHLYPSEQTLELVLQSIMIMPNICTLCLNDLHDFLPFVCDLAMRHQVGIDHDHMEQLFDIIP